MRVLHGPRTAQAKLGICAIDVPAATVDHRETAVIGLQPALACRRGSPHVPCQDPRSCQQGYTGSVRTVMRPVRTWRRHAPTATPPRAPPTLPPPRSLAWALLHDPPHDKPLTARLALAPDAAAAANLARAGLHALRHHNLDAWNAGHDDVPASHVPPFKRLLRGHGSEQDAVTNAFRTTLSNGPAEGQVHRIKLIKRSMYGRASFHLLRNTILYQQPGTATDPDPRPPHLVTLNDALGSNRRNPHAPRPLHQNRRRAEPRRRLTSGRVERMRRGAFEAKAYSFRCAPARVVGALPFGLVAVRLAVCTSRSPGYVSQPGLPFAVCDGLSVVVRL